jgi:hypothetical protein
VPELPAPDTARSRRSLHAAFTAAVQWAVEHPVEAAAAVLLGVGGAAYPPVWLVGTAVAMLSKLWDYRDKWIGLSGPLVLLIVGTATGVVLGGKQPSFGSYVHEGWMYVNLLSRVCALLGTCYLLWRAEHPWPASDVKPWNRPHRVG